MAKNSSTSAIQIEEDLQLQSLFWKIERFGWLTLLGLLVVAFLGFTGAGPLNDAEAANNNLHIKYHPFARQLTSTEIHVQVKNQEKDQASFWIDQTFLSKYQIQRITPEPDQVTTIGNRLLYQFKQNGSSTEVTFYLEPQQVGFINGTIGQDDQKITINQFVYP